MPSHNTTIRYIGQPEGYRSDIPIEIINNCQLKPGSDVGLYFEPDITGIGLSFRANTDDTPSVRALNYDGASRQNAILTLPKQFVKMFDLSGSPVTFFPGRGGLVAQISHTPRLSIDSPNEQMPESTISNYSSGHYGIRAPADIVNPDSSPSGNLLDVISENVWVWLDTTTTGSLAIILDVEQKRAPEACQAVSANPNMLYRKDREIGCLFPIPAGDILLHDEQTIRWSRDGTRLIGVIID